MLIEKRHVQCSEQMQTCLFVVPCGSIMIVDHQRKIEEEEERRKFKD